MKRLRMRARFVFRLLVVLGLLRVGVGAGTQPAQSPPAQTSPAKITVEESKPLPPPRGGLGTTAYAPTEGEKAATKDFKPKETQRGDPETATLLGLVNKRIMWFGMVREIKEDEKAGQTNLLIEMKYFDGLVDTHQQIVSCNGAGDFRVGLPGTGYGLKRLSLAVVQGTIEKEEEKMPVVTPVYMRTWDWGLFAFMNYGEDHGNKKWRDLIKVPLESTYASRPTQRYYEQILGLRE